MKLFKKKAKPFMKKIEEFIEKKFGSNAFKIVFGICFVAILSCIALILLIKIFYSRSFDYLNYTEVSKADYRVNLKENDYYEVDYLPSGMHYIASLINDIEIDFDYSFSTTDKVNYNFIYYVEAITRVYGDKDKATILYEKKENISTKKILNKSDAQYLAFRKTVNIDYAKFNSFVNSFKTSFGLTYNSDVTIVLHVIGNANNSSFDEDISVNGEASIVIPLTEQTISVEIGGNNINNHGSISKKASFDFINIVYIVILIIILLIDIFIIYKLVLIVDKHLKSITKYQKKLKKILREYDSIIATVENNVDTSKYQFVKVSSFDELLDVHDNVGSPILFRETVPGECSHFIIINDNILYRYVLKNDDE